MIELIYIENGLHIKKLLKKAFENYNAECEAWETVLDYEPFVERVFTDVINWYSWDMKEDDNALALLGFDTEIAEDILDSISAFKIELLEDWSVKFKVQYFESNNTIIITYGKTEESLFLPDPKIYAQSYEKMRRSQLTKLARLLNVVRTSKAGELG